MSRAPSSTTSAYAVYPTYPSLNLLAFIPYRNPETVNPPRVDFTLARPFNISPDVYESLLHPALPAIVAALYLVAVWQINKLNKNNGYRPWAFSEKTAFFNAVLVHNIGLAIFSGWIFAGMFRTIIHSWPGWHGQYGLAGVADALCKINGPRGLGSAATFDTTSVSWAFSDISMKLSAGEPDPSDVGRIWNEGLSYFGFLFYLSKMYEIVDTAIILSKGKTTSGLQCFHHAGAMIAVWAGIRYMSPPIWMFTFINSGIHTLMYTYYAVASLQKVPNTLKRTLTTLQITQIVFGTSYALLHLFIAYDIPAAVPYAIGKNLSKALPAISSTVSTAATSLATSADFAAWLKKAALRAAGEEGLAENVRNYQGQTFGIDAVHAAQAEKAQEQITYKMTTQKVHCLDTSGQVFAILLNAIYLIPLAYLFCDYFIKAYLGHAKQDGSKDDAVKNYEPIPSSPENIKKSAQEAVERVRAKITRAIDDTQGGVTEAPPDVKAQLDDLHTKSKQIAKHADEAIRDRAIKAREEMLKDVAKMQQRLTVLREKGNDVGERAVNKIKDVAADLSKNAKEGTAKAQQGARDLGNKAKDTAGPVLDEAAKKASSLAQSAQNGSDKAAEAASEKGETAKDEADHAANDVGNAAKDAAKTPADGAKDAGNGAKESTDDAANKVSGDVNGSASKVSADTEKSAKDVADAAKDTNEAAVAKNEEQGNDKKDESEKSIAPSTSTTDDQSTKDSASGSRDTTPSGTPDKSKKRKDKKDKKDAKKGNWWSKKP